MQFLGVEFQTLEEGNVYLLEKDVHLNRHEHRPGRPLRRAEKPFDIPGNKSGRRRAMRA